MIRTLDVASSVAATLTRGFAGLQVGALGPRPTRPLELYEFESCPFCRKVREALTELDLEAELRPCPKGGPRFREHVIRTGGKAQFPWLVDPNTGDSMYESDAIVQHLYRHYGSGSLPLHHRIGVIGQVTGTLASALRGGRGTRYRTAEPPAEPLELWSFEASPFSRLVRETLSELELPYRLHNVGRGSPSRAAFVERSGKMQVPYLVDPNGGVEMFESADIVAYLEASYSA